MESGTIVRWLKSEGDAVEKGEPLYEVDTEKVTQEVEADASGVLLRIAVAEGEVPVGGTIAVIGAEGEDVPDVSAGGDGDGAAAREVEERPEEEGSPADARDDERERGRQAAAEAAAQETPAARAGPTNGGRIKASPLARRIAREKGVDLGSVRGTGPEGRIVAEDVERAVAAPAPAAPAAPAAAPGEVEVVPLSQTRRTIARRLTEAWQAPVFMLTVSADMTNALALREQLVANLREGEAKPTVSDVLTRLTAAALVRHPAVNAHFAGEEIRRFPSADVGLAVAAPAGLVVPVIRGADRLSIAEIAAARADLVSRAREGRLQRADLESGTFTISNLGMYGVEEFTAVLNPPQAAILAVGAIVERPVAVDGMVDVAPMMTMTLTCDHRAVDGSDGAEFLRTLKALVEQPALAL
jgi:pyruvate dehydrogenase E2 component (dihydrolipoamide acetyltransferase)